jgi:hypothetical protein
MDLINSFLFHPRKAYTSIQSNDILINIEPGIKIGIRHHMINKKSPNILFFHGNGEIGPEYDDVASVFNQNNINFIISDYRGYGFSNGHPNIENTQKDAHIILDYIINFLSLKSFVGPIVLIGRSLGSASVLELSTRYPNDFLGIVIESGFINEKPILKLIGIDNQIDYNYRNGFQNNKKVAEYKGPLLVIHAEKDHIIPFNHGKKIIEISKSNMKKFIPISNANHNNILSVDSKTYFNEINKFIIDLNK